LPSNICRTHSRSKIKWHCDLIQLSTAMIGKLVCVEEIATVEWLVLVHARSFGIINSHNEYNAQTEPDQNERKRSSIIPLDTPSSTFHLMAQGF
jgi:hypothetical protein